MLDGKVTDMNKDDGECLEHYKRHQLVPYRVRLMDHQLTRVENAINDRHVDCDQKKGWLNHEHL